MKWILRASLVCGLACSPSVLEAHLVTTGLGPVYDGIGHLLLTPEDFIAVLALCFFAGLKGPAHSRMVLWCLPLVWFLAGRIVGFQLEVPGTFPVAAISFILLGVLVATDVRISIKGTALIAVILGLVHGVENGTVLKEGVGFKGLLGIMVALFVLTAIVTAIVVSLKQPWMRIVVRVLGSWIVAIGILILGWHYRPAPMEGIPEPEKSGMSFVQPLNEQPDERIPAAYQQLAYNGDSCNPENHKASCFSFLIGCKTESG